MLKAWKLILPIVLALVVWLMPREWFGLEGLTESEHRVIGIFVLAAFMWVLQPIPVYATSLLVIFLELFIASDQGFKPLMLTTDEAGMGHLLGYKEVLSTFASPIIILFLGGFFLAMAATKFRLDQNLARVMLKPFGTKPSMLLFGLMLITAVFSMFMSNTATTAMMMAILTPVLTQMPAGDRGKAAFVLGIPIAANIGGIGTPIGTPPNAIALKYLTGENAISFGEWLVFGVPYVLLLLVISWFILRVMYPSSSQSIELKIKGTFLQNPKAYLVYAVFALTIVLWLTDFLHGMNSYVVAMLPVAVFSLTGIINKEDLKTISWDVLWLVSGGIALGVGLEKTGLATRLVTSIPFAEMSPYVVVIAASLLALVMANLMSHTATANLLLPIVAAIAAATPALEPLGGTRMMVLVITFACSLGMSLPISTPPNALAFGTGLVDANGMAKSGMLIGIIGLALSFLLMYFLKLVHFF